MDESMSMGAGYTRRHWEGDREAGGMKYYPCDPSSSLQNNLDERMVKAPIGSIRHLHACTGGLLPLGRVVPSLLCLPFQCISLPGPSLPVMDLSVCG